MANRLLLLLASIALLACGEPQTPLDPIVRVRVDRVATDHHHLPVVLLAEHDGPRWLAIWIGVHEARSIAAEMRNEPAIRPNTHDLAERIIQDLDGELVQVVVTELRGSTYIARLELRAAGRGIEIDARPSDAIAIALRADVPIFVNSSLLENGPREIDERAPRRDI